MQSNMKGMAILPTVKDLAAIATGIVYILPSPLRLVRTTAGDNGFSGVRVLTAKKVFLKDVSQDEQFAEQMQDVNTVEQAGEQVNNIINELDDGAYLIVSPGMSAKYIVCNPRHNFVVTVIDGITHIATASKETWKKVLKPSNKEAKYKVVETAFASFV
jgi:hypothetical protein